MVVGDFMRQDMDVSAFPYTQKALEADVICFQRPSSEPSLKLAKLLKEKGKKIIFDNDDTYEGIPLARLGSEKRVAIAQQLSRNLNEFVKIADGVTVTTEILAKEYGKLNPNVAVLKNCIDPLDEYPCKPNTTGKWRVGIIGSVTSNDDYYHIKDQLKALDARGDITIVILGVKHRDGGIIPGMQEDYDFWNSLKNIEWHTTVHVTEYMYTVSQLALDVAIIPRKDHYFNYCKSNLKFLDMSLLKIPVIAQGFPCGLSPYQGADEPYLKLVVDNDLWYNEILKAKEKYSSYLLKAQQAHDYVLENYSIINYAPVWTQTIERLCKYQPSS